MNNDYQKLEEKIIELQTKIDNLILLVTEQQHQQETKKQDKQIKFPIIEISLNEWCNKQTITTTDYELLNYYFYHESLKIILLKKCEETKENLPIYYNKNKLYIHEKNNQWKQMELIDVKDLLEKINFKIHNYFFEYIDCQNLSELQHLQFCKMNENKFRETQRLKEAHKSLMQFFNQ
jgi:hypothetical protein